MALRECKECGGNVSTKARDCPHCGARRSRPLTAFLAIVLLLILSILFLLSMATYH